MVNFRDLSIRYKLTLINLLISGTILLLSSSIFITYDLLQLQRSLHNDTAVTAKMLAYHSSAPLGFNFPTDAGDALTALRANPHIVTAQLYQLNGQPFASYHRRSAQQHIDYTALKLQLVELLMVQAFNFDETESELIQLFIKAQDKQFLTYELRENFAVLLEKKANILSNELIQGLLALLQQHQHLLPDNYTVESNTPRLQQDAQYLYVSQIVFDTEANSTLDEPIGSLYLIVSLEDLRNRIIWYLLLALGIVLGAIGLAFFLTSRLQGMVVRPILALAKLMRQVSHAKDYSLRNDYHSGDELGVLSGGFNTMLSTIEEREAQLARHSEELEQTVAERTAELKKLNKQLTYQAFHDALTNLPNRALFVQQVEQAIKHVQEQAHKQHLAMLFIDLDHFKYINDTLGHSAGDRILQEVAKRLLACTRQPEDLVARLGGDEFTVLLRNVKEPLNAGIVAGKILRALAMPFRFNVQDLYVTPSIGISIYPDDGEDVGTLMRNADTSMYVAKQQGRNNYQFYTAGANSASANRLKMENKLRQALEFDEFEVWYQPRFALASGHLVGAEALVRWRSPEQKLVPPAQFIPLAEDTGLIIPIGEKVLRTACEDNMNWLHPKHAPLEVSVNLSARQFIQEDLLSKIEDLCEELKMPPERLELELTESLIMPKAEETIETLRALKDRGVKISVDDFGTGYSSLSYLKRFPIDVLKIDQSFIYDINNDADDTTLVTAIIAMAHKLNLQVVAEGVETQHQLDFLRQHQCDYVQGFLMGKPIPAKAFQYLIEQDCNIDSYPLAVRELKENGKAEWLSDVEI